MLPCTRSRKENSKLQPMPVEGYPKVYITTPTHKLECLALKWAICEHFYNYPYDTEFKVVTNNNLLTYVMTTAKLDAVGHHWLVALSTYRFDIKYRAGNRNQDMDGLFRRLQDPSQEDDAFHKEKQRIKELRLRVLDRQHEMFSMETLPALCQRHFVKQEKCGCLQEPPTFAESLVLNVTAIPGTYSCFGQDKIQNPL